jgi:hypothetical protein
MTLGARELSLERTDAEVSRVVAWLAWSMCVVSSALTALSLFLLILTLSHSGVPIYRFWGENTLLVLSNSLIGAVVASRRPDHPIGWLMCTAGLLWGVVHFSGEYVTYALLAAPRSLPAGEAITWLYCWLWVPGLGLGVFLGLLFPTGRLPSRRWRPFAWLSVLLVAVGTVMAAFSSGPIPGFVSVRNPLGIEGLPNLYEPLQALVLALIFVASVSLLLRLRRARGVERQQIKWFVTATMVVGSASILTYTIFEAIDTRWLELAGYALVLVGLLGMPTTLGIAILRYKLYDLDVVINRTLVYGLLTTLLAAGYFGSIILLEGIGSLVFQVPFRALTGQDTQLASVAATLAMAALFTPLRRRIQRFIDRRFYRRKYDARKTLETLSAKLREETDLDALSDDLVEAVRETMQPTHVSLWLHPDPALKDKKKRADIRESGHDE